MRHLLFTGTVLALLPLAGNADEKKADPVPPLPAKAQLVAKQTTYKLDLGGKTAAEFRQMVKDVEKGGRAPATPMVDLMLEITNTSDKEIKIWDRGDPVQVLLTMSGPGVATAKPRLAFTADFRTPMSVTLAPGKSLAIPIKSLTYGFRGASNMMYWTEPGEYKLSASFQTGIAPPPKGTKERDGFGPVTLVTEPVTLKVEEK